MDFADGGWANIEQHMRINFEAPVRLVEALLPLMRRTAAGGVGAGRAVGEVTGSAEAGQPASFGGRPLEAPVAIVNVTSTSARIARLGTGAYSASKAAFGAWSDSLFLEERRHGVHVADVLPGFIATEGFPQSELKAEAADELGGLRSRAGRRGDHRGRAGRRARSYVPRYYWMGALLRVHRAEPDPPRRLKRPGRTNTHSV